MKRHLGDFAVVMVIVIGVFCCVAYGMVDGGNIQEGEKGERKLAKMGMMDMMDDIGVIDVMRKGMMLKDYKLQKELDLSDDQKARLQKIYSNEERESIKIEADIKTLHLDLKYLLEESIPDNTRIDSKIDEIAIACAALAKTQIHAIHDAKRVLTPSQKKKYNELMIMDAGIK